MKFVKILLTLTLITSSLYASEFTFEHDNSNDKTAENIKYENVCALVQFVKNAYPHERHEAVLKSGESVIKEDGDYQIDAVRILVEAVNTKTGERKATLLHQSTANHVYEKVILRLSHIEVDSKNPKKSSCSPSFECILNKSVTAFSGSLHNQ